MSALKDASVPLSTAAELRDKYRTPMYFDWERGRPYTARGMAVIYILGFADDIVKVGHTEDFETRLFAHAGKMSRAGHRFVCGWRLGTDDALADETKLISLAFNAGGQRIGRSSEWFSGLDVLALIARAEEDLVFYEATG